MSMSCSIKGCSSSSDQGIKLYMVPEIIKNQGSKCETLSIERRKAWLVRISPNLKNMGQAVRHIKVCSRHFYSEPLPGLFDRNNPDWSPTLNLTPNLTVNQLVITPKLSTTGVMEHSNVSIARVVMTPQDMLSSSATAGCDEVPISKAAMGPQNVPSYVATKGRSKKSGSNVVDGSEVSSSESVIRHPEGAKLVSKSHSKSSRSTKGHSESSSSESHTTKKSMSSILQCKKSTIPQKKYSLRVAPKKSSKRRDSDETITKKDKRKKKPVQESSRKVTPGQRKSNRSASNNGKNNSQIQLTDVEAQSFTFETISTEVETEEEMITDAGSEHHGIDAEIEDSELISLKFVKTESGSRQCLKCLQVFDELGDFDEHVDGCYNRCKTYPVEMFPNIAMKLQPSELCSEGYNSERVCVGDGFNIKQNSESPKTVFTGNCYVTDTSPKIIDNVDIKVEVNVMIDNNDSAENEEVRTGNVMLSNDETPVDPECKTEADNSASEPQGSFLETGVVDELEADNDEVPMVPKSNAMPVVSDSNKNVAITGMYCNILALGTGQPESLLLGTHYTASRESESGRLPGRDGLSKFQKRTFDRVLTADTDGCYGQVVKWPSGRMVSRGLDVCDTATFETDSDTDEQEAEVGNISGRTECLGPPSKAHEKPESRQSNESGNIIKRLRKLLPKNRFYDCFFRNCTQYFQEGEIDQYKAHLQQELTDSFLSTNRYINGMSLQKMQSSLSERNLDWPIFTCNKFECEFMCFYPGDIMTHITSTHVCTKENCGETFSMKDDLVRHKIYRHSQFSRSSFYALRLGTQSCSVQKQPDSKEDMETKSDAADMLDKPRLQRIHNMFSKLPGKKLDIINANSAPQNNQKKINDQTESAEYEESDKASDDSFNLQGALTENANSANCSSGSNESVPDEEKSLVDSSVSKFIEAKAVTLNEVQATLTAKEISSSRQGKHDKKISTIAVGDSVKKKKEGKCKARNGRQQICKKSSKLKDTSVSSNGELQLAVWNKEKCNQGLEVGPGMDRSVECDKNSNNDAAIRECTTRLQMSGSNVVKHAFITEQTVDPNVQEKNFDDTMRETSKILLSNVNQSHTDNKKVNMGTEPMYFKIDMQCAQMTDSEKKPSEFMPCQNTMADELEVDCLKSIDMVPKGDFNSDESCLFNAQHCNGREDLNSTEVDDLYEQASGEKIMSPLESDSSFGPDTKAKEILDGGALEASCTLDAVGNESVIPVEDSKTFDVEIEDRAVLNSAESSEEHVLDKSEAAICKAMELDYSNISETMVEDNIDQAENECNREKSAVLAPEVRNRSLAVKIEIPDKAECKEGIDKEELSLQRQVKSVLVSPIVYTETDKNTKYPFKCQNNNCSARFSSSEQLKKHIKDAHMNNPVPCKITGCSKVFTDVHSLIQHQMVQHVQSDTSIYRNMDVDHAFGGIIKTVDGISCNVCSAVLPNFACLRSHMAMHEYTCQLCSFTADTADALKNHLKIQHSVSLVRFGDRKKLVPCKIKGCAKLFPTVPDLLEHQLKIHVKPSIKTNNVDRNSKSGNAVGEVQVSISDALEVEAEADTVENMEGNNDDKQQQTVHSKNTCHICCQILESPEAVASHMQEHMYTCHVCSFTTETFKSLKVHLVDMHSVLPFACQCCDQTFKSRKEVMCHVQKKHWDLDKRSLPYKCKIDDCSEAFLFERDLSKHYHSAHEMVVSCRRH